MTEDEAKTKVCSGARAAGLGEDIKCIASQCMKWRATYAAAVVDGVGKVAPDQKSWGAGYYVKRIQDGGYCGLAGPVT
jgi:hypothetical protein